MVLTHPQLTLVITLVTIGVSVYLYIVVPKGFFPQQDTGQIGGNILADQDISFTAMREKLHAFLRIVEADPAVDDVVGLYRRRHVEHRQHVDAAEAVGRTQDLGGRRH